MLHGLSLVRQITFNRGFSGRFRFRCFTSFGGVVRLPCYDARMLLVCQVRDWLVCITWCEYCVLIGWFVSRGLNAVL